jgi:hypothetical protein
LTLKVSSKIRKIQCELIGDALLCHSKHFTPLPKCMEENLRLEHPHTQAIHGLNHWVKFDVLSTPTFNTAIYCDFPVLYHHIMQNVVGGSCKGDSVGGRFQFGRSRCFFQGRSREHTLNGAIVRGHHDMAASQRTCS